MDDPILQIILNGTNAAAASGQISANEAERLNKEAVEAAALDVESEI